MRGDGDSRGHAVADNKPSSPPESAPLPSGTLEGSVTYEANPKRPWIYGRYYIRDRKTGRLAEAVVCLTGGELKARKDLPAVTHAIDQKNFLFEPETISIRAGDRVTFSNSDPQVHNVNSSSLEKFDVTVPPGGTSTVDFIKAGGIRRPVTLGCKFHSGMRAWIYVIDHPFHTVTAADGSFRFADVPPGKYTLHVVHPAGGLQTSQPVQVVAGKTLQIPLKITPADRLTAN